MKLIILMMACVQCKLQKGLDDIGDNENGSTEPFHLGLQLCISACCGEAEHMGTVSGCLKRKIKWARERPQMYCTAKSCCKQSAIKSGSVMTWKTVSQKTNTSRFLIMSRLILIQKREREREKRELWRIFCFNALLDSELHLKTSSDKGRNSRCCDYRLNWLSAYHFRFGSHC